MNHLRARRLSVMALTVGITALCVSACGSSSSTGSSSSSSSSAAAGGTGSAAGTGTFNRTTFTACLKSHGVTLPPRPAGAAGGAPGAAGGAGAPPSGSGTRPRGGGAFFGGGAGAGGRFANNPKLAAAFKACGGGRGFAAGRRFAFNHAAVTKFVACVKQHGFELPAPNFSGKGSVFPASIEKNKKFQAASKACATDLRPAGAGSGAGGAGAPAGAASSTTGT